ncbi:MAG: hypothetical protein V1664_02365 [Candidatus Uhrbacteria bacterium]
MLPDPELKIEELAKRYFEDELGLAPEDVPEAARNLLGAFEVLLQIDERINPQSIQTF